MRARWLAVEDCSHEEIDAPRRNKRRSPKRGFAGALGAKTAPGMRRVGVGCAVSQYH
jgi:hypothetical protein